MDKSKVNSDYYSQMDLRNKEPENKLEKFKSIFPNCFQEGEIDIEKLLVELDLKEADDNGEKYGFNWVGKKKCIAGANAASIYTLRFDNKTSFNHQNSNNIIIEGDNLEVLKILQKSYQNKVDVIYIDPPYNTGNDFIYKDNFKDPSKAYCEQTNQVDEEGNRISTNIESQGRLHTNWFNMIYPRLLLARNLLKENGIIFISIDDNEQARLKLICDEIFGEENFIGIIHNINNIKGRQISNRFSQTGEYVLCYHKKILLLDLNEVDEKYANDNMPSVYNERGTKRLSDRYGEFICQNELHNSNINAFNINTRPNLFFPIYIDTVDKKISLSKTINSIELLPPKNQHGLNGVWRWSREKIIKDSHNLYVVSKNNKWKIYTKKRNFSFSFKNLIIGGKYSNKTGTNLMEKLGFNNCDFSYPKPIELIKLLINLHKNNNALILDFFAGSGTTAHAVMDLNKEDDGNRKYILVQLPESIKNNNQFNNICEITRERIKRSIEMYDYKNEGFKSFKLDSSNIKEWDPNMAESDNQLELFENKLREQSDRIKEGRTTEDLLYEIILKKGFDLTTEFESTKTKNNIFWYDTNKQFIYVESDSNYKDVHNELINFIVDEKLITIKYIIFNDSWFIDDSNKVNCMQQLHDFNPEIKLEVI